MQGTRSFKRQLYRVLENGGGRDVASVALRSGLVLLILATVIAASAETVPSLYAPHRLAFGVFDSVAMLIFTVEYALRVWVSAAPGGRATESPIAARLRYMRTPMAVIDLLAILPFWLAPLLVSEPLSISVWRLLVMFKLARYSTALGTLGRVLGREWRALVGALLIMLGLLILAATVMYYIERNAQPQVFSSIPAALWWAMSAISTVGYGDIVPITTLGRFFAGFITILGIGAYALPVGIVATGFATEIQRRDFVVTWGMVARVPLFSSLDAVDIMRIAGLLRSQVVPAGYTIVHRGEPADCMYMIASGEVEVKVRPTPVRLTEGDFFGEIALLQDTLRSATVEAVTRCQLMILDAADFRALLANRPELRAAVMAVAEARSHNP